MTNWNVPLTFIAKEEKSTIRLNEILLSNNVESNLHNIYFKIYTNVATEQTLFMGLELDTLVDIEFKNITTNDIKISERASNTNIITSTNYNWIKYTKDTVIELTNVNDFVLFRNTSETFSTTERLIKFEMTGKIAATGNIQSLLNFSENVPIYSFYKLFDNCKSLLTAPQLLAKNVGPYSYALMFNNCTSLINSPKLTSTELAYGCYRYMFAGCTALKNAPNLLAEILAPYCYEGMFFNCKKINSAINLPAETLVEGCYNNMFNGCSELEYIAANFTQWNLYATKNWLVGVKDKGTLKCNVNLPDLVIPSTPSTYKPLLLDSLLDSWFITEENNTTPSTYKSLLLNSLLDNWFITEENNTTSSYKQLLLDSQLDNWFIAEENNTTPSTYKQLLLDSQLDNWFITKENNITPSNYKLLKLDTKLDSKLKVVIDGPVLNVTYNDLTLDALLDATLFEEHTTYNYAYSTSTIPIGWKLAKANTISEKLFYTSYLISNLPIGRN